MPEQTGETPKALESFLETKEVRRTMRSESGRPAAQDRPPQRAVFHRPGARADAWRAEVVQEEHVELAGGDNPRPAPQQCVENRRAAPRIADDIQHSRPRLIHGDGHARPSAPGSVAAMPGTA